MLFTQLAAFYKASDWPMEMVQDAPIMATTYLGNNGEWPFVVSTDEENRIFVMFARAPEPCPQEKIDTMAQFLELANFRMTHGAWVIDRSDGEIRYRVGVDMGTMRLTDQYISDLTFYTNLTMETYLDSIRAINNGKMSAHEAFAAIFPEDS